MQKKNLFDDEEDHNRDYQRFPLERTIFLGGIALIVWFVGWLFTNVSEIKTHMNLIEYRLTEVEKKANSFNRRLGSIDGNQVDLSTNSPPSITHLTKP